MSRSLLKRDLWGFQLLLAADDDISTKEPFYFPLGTAHRKPKHSSQLHLMDQQSSVAFASGV